MERPLQTIVDRYVVDGFDGRIVNGRSRIAAISFMVATLISLAAGSARADRVIFGEATGNASEERVDAVMEALIAAARDLGHEAEMLSWSHDIPQTSDEMNAIAAARNATYVVVPQITAMPGQYRLLLRVGYAPASRVEELEANVVEAEQQARLRDILGAMLRPEGLGEDAVRLSEGDPEAERLAREQREREERERAERERLAREEEARREFEAREAARRAEAQRRAREQWATRERYGDDEERPWIGLIGIGAASLIARPEQSRGGPWIGDLRLRIGHAVDGVSGLEVRGGAELWFGSASAVGLTGGAVLMFSPWTYPVFLGVEAEAGLLILTSGSQTARLLARAGFTGIWRAGERFYVEASPFELTLITGQPSSLAMGLSARAGVRF